MWGVERERRRRERGGERVRERGGSREIKLEMERGERGEQARESKRETQQRSVLRGPDLCSGKHQQNETSEQSAPDYNCHQPIASPVFWAQEAAQPAARSYQLITACLSEVLSVDKCKRFSAKYDQQHTARKHWKSKQEF